MSSQRTRRIPADHGPSRCHRVDCGAPPCKDARNAYYRRVTRLKAYGRWHPWVPAEPVREHVLALREAGMSVKTIGTVAEVSPKAMSALLYGAAGNPPTEKMLPGTAQRLLAVRPDPELLDPKALILAVGTARRLQALSSIGWTQAQLASMVGMTEEHVSKIAAGKVQKVSAGTAVKVRGVYDEVWASPPPAGYGATRARMTAQRHGWAPPLAWDDDTIDDPAAAPEGTEPVSYSSLKKLPTGPDLLWLVDTLGEHPEAVADRFGAHKKTVSTALSRAREKAASA